MRTQSRHEDNLLSIADLSRHFSLPESTTRYYCKRFAAFIPAVGEGRRRRYRPETKEIISTILEEMQKSRTAQAVEQALESRFPRNALAIHENTLATPAGIPGENGFLPAAALHLMERQTVALEGIAQIVRLMVEKIPFAVAQSPEKAEEYQQLRKDLDNLRTLLLASEKTQQADLEQLRQWMAKLIQRRDAQQTALA